jgi:YD repeat-containing protein
MGEMEMVKTSGPKHITILAVVTALALLAGMLAYPASGLAYNKPWDQGHDGTYPQNPNNPNKPPKPPNNPCKGSGSPILLQTGNFMLGYIDMVMQACGMPIKITRVYNSFDEHDGLFGFGWTLSYGIRILPSETVNNVRSAVILMPNGQRFVFTRNADGSYTRPVGTVFELVFANNQFVLTDNINLEYTFNAAGYCTKIQDRAGNQVSLAYGNMEGCISTIGDGSGRAMTFTYGPNGKIASITDPEGNTMQYQYDGAGNLVTVIDPEGKQTTYTYDARHHITSVKNHLNETLITVTYQTTEPWRVTQYQEGGETWTITYVSATRTQKRNSANNTFTYDFDANGVITQVTSHMGNVTKHGYDGQYNYQSYTDPNNNVTTFAYDAAGNLVQVTDAANASFAMAYDAAGNVDTITDNEGRQGAFDYDAESNLTRITPPIGNPINVTYDASGYITSITRGADSLTFTKDSHCNLTGLVSSGGANLAFAYDNLGNVTSVTSSAGAVGYSYNARNQITHVTDTTGGVTVLAYDNAARLAQVTFPGGSTMGFTYSKPAGYSTNAPTLTQIQLQDGSTYTYDFWSFDKVKTKRESGVITRQFAYDADQRLTGVTMPSGRTVTYAYDNANNVIGITDSVLGNINLAYDAVNRLTGLANAGDISETFRYSTVGNRTRWFNDQNLATDYAYDAANRLTGWTDTAGQVHAVNPPASAPGKHITLNDIIGLYASRQNNRLLSYLVQRTPEQLVGSYDSLYMEYNRYLGGIPETLATGFSVFVLPFADQYSTPGVVPITDFLELYKRLGLGW